MNEMHSVKFGNRVKNLTGQKFNSLTALRMLETRNRGYVIWECKCDCGNLCQVSSGKLLSNNTKSCGCLAHQKEKDNSKFKDLTGIVFGRLTVVELSDFRNHASYWLCRCECGNTTTVFGGSLNYGSVKSCGCIRKEVMKEKQTKHGNYSLDSTTSRAYNSWRLMIGRCTDPKNDSFNSYGAKGIAICDQWLDFSCFLSDMGECLEGQTIDRIDNEKGYEPENCRWANIFTQNRNKKTVRKIEFNGKNLTLPEWSEITGIPRSRLWQRINIAKWSIEKTLTTLVG